MKEKLEFKILGIGIAILIVGVAVTSFLVLMVERADIYSLAESRLEATAKVITKGIERTMLEGKAEVAKPLIEDLKSVSGFEGIEVYNWEGREAFKPDAPPVEKEALETIVSTGTHITVKKGKTLIFYRPLKNLPSCQGCHAPEKSIIGAVKVSVSLEKEYEKIANFLLMVAVGSLIGIGVLGSIFWWIIRRFVITPLKTLEYSAAKMAGGDLSFHTGIKTNDEIGRLDKSIKESLQSISSILQRVKEVSKRISNTSDMVEDESRKVVESTQLEAEAIADISSSMDQLNAAITEIAESTESLAASVEETAASMEEMATSISSVTNLTHELSGGIEATSSSIEELSATIKEVAQNAEELARVSDETLSSVEEIISSIKEVEVSAKESAKLSSKVADDASTLGVTSMNKTMEGMQKIKVSVEKTAGAIRKLGGRSEEIGKILNVIDEITDQTTLLALNAAILAAQAGEHGKGFSVVADEIKDLAERTALSTQEISQLIQSVRQEVKDAIEAMEDGLVSVNEGIELTKESSDALKKILDSSKLSSEMAYSIERSTTEQARAARHVSEAIERVRIMVGQIAKATSEQSKGVSLIIKAAERMRDASHQVDISTEQQAASSRQISKAVEMISDKSQQISRAIYEQKVGSNQIWASIEKIKNIPSENRDLAFRINKLLRELVKDSELVSMEMEKFKLYEDGITEIIRFGVVPLESPADMYKKFTPLIDYLSRELGKKFELKVAPDYETAVRELGQGITQLCYMTPHTYIEAHKTYGARLLVKALRDGKPYHHSVIITQEGSNIRSVKDIKNRSFAFGDVHSTSSHIVPRAMLLEEGIDLKDLSYYNYLGHHDDIVRAVLKGEFDAGGVKESTAFRFKDQGLRFIKFSDEIPEFNICASSSFDAAAAEALKSVLKKLNDKVPESAAILSAIDKSYTGFTDARDEDYDGIRQMMLKMGML
jgi:phosphate/phosphite/phosphonate ABC transporter binding protein